MYFSTYTSFCRCVLLELDESIFLRIYGPEWEGGENLSNVLVVTLADYFQVTRRGTGCAALGLFVCLYSCAADLGGI